MNAHEFIWASFIHADGLQSFLSSRKSGAVSRDKRKNKDRRNTCSTLTLRIRERKFRRASVCKLISQYRDVLLLAGQKYSARPCRALPDDFVSAVRYKYDAVKVEPYTSMRMAIDQAPNTNRKFAEFSNDEGLGKKKYIKRPSRQDRASGLFLRQAFSTLSSSLRSRIITPDPSRKATSCHKKDPISFFIFLSLSVLCERFTATISRVICISGHIVANISLPLLTTIARVLLSVEGFLRLYFFSSFCLFARKALFWWQTMSRFRWKRVQIVRERRNIHWEKNT